MEIFVKIDLLFIWKVYHQEIKLVKFQHCFKYSLKNFALISNFIFFIYRVVLTREVPILKQCTLTWKKSLECDSLEVTREVTNG